MNDSLVMIPGLALVGMACIGTPPLSTSGLWIEFDNKVNSKWEYVPDKPAYVKYKVKSNAS